MLSRIVKELTAIRAIVALLLALIPIFVAIPQEALALTTADITVNATPAYVEISCNVSTYNFGTVAASSTTDTPSTSYLGITDSSTVQTDQTISVTGATWTGGNPWTHDDLATPGAMTVGLKSNRGGAWGAGDVIVKNAAPDYIYENNAAGNDYAFGLRLLAPTSYTDGVEKTNTVRITAVVG